MDFGKGEQADFKRQCDDMDFGNDEWEIDDIN